MVELARALEGRMDLRDVRGLAALDRSTGKVAEERAAPPRGRPRHDPRPGARPGAALALPRLRQPRQRRSRSRGCPYECIFCSAPPGRGARCATETRRSASTRSSASRALGFTEITIEDDLFTLYRKHFLAVCGELIERKTGIRWNAFSRVDTITPEIVKTMAEAGCQAICFGVESGNQEVLDLVKKSSNLAKVKEAMRMTQEVGISALASFIIGLPGETAETLRKTVEFANELHHEFGSLYGFHILAPFPGTEVRDRAAEYGLEILNSDWREYDANHVVSRTPGADPAAIQAVADEYEETIERYVRYQDHLYATGQLRGLRAEDRTAVAGARRCSGSCCSTRSSRRCRRCPGTASRS